MAATRATIGCHTLVALGLVLSPGTSGRADDRVGAGITYHTDTDGLTVTHPAASARIAAGEDVHVSAGYQADVISAATVDVRTAASSRPFEEVRHGADAGVDVALARLTTLSAGYALSVSPDYLSNALSVSLRHELDDRRHALTFALSGAHDSVGRFGDPAPTGEALTLAASARWAIVLSRDAVVDLGGAVEHRRGYMESPYRFVTVAGAGSQVRLPEEVPDERWRFAVGGGLRWAIAEPFYVRASYRLHADDWGVLGHTVTVSGHLAPAPGWLVTVSGRSLAQRGATFYSGAYATLPDIPVLRTRDRTLAPHWSLAAEADVRIPFARVGGFDLGARVRGAVLWHRYFDTPLLPERTSFQASLTLIAER
ncbi:MAG: DUF3570 domain-containing protein [Sandaracinaceae bacterium]|nr:DUF3570 domain-containing protein [Sandaracinaceae bacterium]